MDDPMDVRLEMLDQCADMVLRCDDRDIPCVRFNMLSLCDAVRHVAEDLPLGRDDRGRSILPFPGVDGVDLALAIEVIHGVRPIRSLGHDDTHAAMRGMDALGNSSVRLLMMEQLWHTCETYAHMLPHLDDLAHTASIRHVVLRRLVVMFPTWRAFEHRVLEHVRMDAELAKYMLQYLGDFFPASMLFDRLLRMLPAAVTDGATALSLFSECKCLMQFHPGEAVAVVRALHAKFAEAGWDPATRAFLKALLAVEKRYEVTPFVARTMHGTIIHIDNAPARPATSKSSALVRLAWRAVVTRKLDTWLRMTVDSRTGVVTAQVLMAELDDQRLFRGECQVRLMAYTTGESSGGEPGVCEEAWYVFEGLSRNIPFEVTDGMLGAGDPLRLASVVSLGCPKWLRLDVFYGGHNVLQHAFF